MRFGWSRYPAPIPHACGCRRAMRASLANASMLERRRHAEVGAAGSPPRTALDSCPRAHVVAAPTRAALAGEPRQGAGTGASPSNEAGLHSGGPPRDQEIESASTDTQNLPQSASALVLRQASPLLADRICATAACAVGVSTTQTTRRTRAVTTFHEPCGCWVGTGGRRPRGAPRRQGGQQRGVG